MRLTPVMQRCVAHRGGMGSRGLKRPLSRTHSLRPLPAGPPHTGGIAAAPAVARSSADVGLKDLPRPITRPPRRTSPEDSAEDAQGAADRGDRGLTEGGQHNRPPALPGTAPAGIARHPGLRGVLGEPAWQRLPAAVQERFGDPVRAVDYSGTFEVVRASLAGRALALVCLAIGTPVVPRTGRNVPAVVRVGPSAEGARWIREYRWPAAAPQRVLSTKVIAPDGTLVEELPARLCMQLQVHEAGGALHFVSRRYCFRLSLPFLDVPVRLFLPPWLSPGTVHVVHQDEAQGWFRFTMTVAHPLLGELFHQTGRFHATGRLTCPPPSL